MEFPVPQGKYRELSLFLRHSGRWMPPNRRKFCGFLAGSAIQWNREEIRAIEGKHYAVAAPVSLTERPL